MTASPEDPIVRRLTPEEVEEIRRSMRDEKRLFDDVRALLRRVGRKLPFAEDVLAAYYCALDPATERRVKLTILAALAYFVMPFDVLPDLLPLIGFTDDAAVIATAIATVAGAIKPEHRERAKETLDADA
ncbi:YkvA family protein [Alsobacter sp. SYSU M60028]|uniref:YkvA family protein n=1 Tax=Alsobacter ponti TaxID=2962936 RepID=A0ABT1LGR6_9HYPH|nr:YkvA family protein [Alsobacter ponti]MCP8940146.1 YkvA family protein [Alsobacter ponti]